MPNSTFDASQMKMHLKQHLEQIGDLLTTAEDIEQYADFTGALNDLNRLTEDHYTLSPEGTFPLVTVENKKKLQEAYQNAIQAASRIAAGQETGPVNIRLRTIAGELLPMLETDNAALEMTNVARTPVTLPVLIGNARAQAVDMGDQQAEIATGQMSSRQHIKVQNGRTIEEGYFTPTTTQDLEKRCDAHLDRMEKKYPKFRTLIDAFKNTNKDTLLATAVEYEIFDYCDGNMSPDEIRNAALEICRDDIFAPVGIGPDVYREHMKDPDFLKFMDEFGKGMIPLKNDHKVYRSGGIVDLPEGTNIDKRNVGMTRMADMLGKPRLVAEARPMMLIENGKPVVGTFMRNAPGLDMTRVKVDDPFTNFTTENFNDPAAFSDIAAMQALDFICGNVDRHTGNFFMRFDKDPHTNPDAKLVGLSLIDNDLSFSDATAADTANKGSRFVTPDQMGVIGEDTYNAIKAMTKEAIQFALADCDLTQEELDKVWERKEALQHKIEEDMAFFADKQVGELAADKIRVVKEDEWDQYPINKIAEIHEKSQFKVINTSPSLPRQYENSRNRAAEKAQKLQAARDIFYGNAPQQEAEAAPQQEAEAAPQQEAEAAPQQHREIPIGQVVGNGIAQEADPLNAAREETIRLVVPDLAKIKSVGNFLSERFPIKYQTGQGEQEAFFTARSEQSLSYRMNKMFENAIRKNPQYADDLRKIQTYLNITERDMDADPDIDREVTRFGKPNSDYEAVGISPERAEQLRNDNAFWAMYANDIGSPGIRMLGLKEQYEDYGVAVGQQIETRNVAMSDISEVLGVSSLVAKSTTAQINSGGMIVDGVLMNKAEGVDIQNIGSGHPMKLITEEKAKAVYDQPDALRKLADLQVLDYLCNNTDRHELNMTYQFEGLETDAPKFIGPQGFDNDASFGANAPDPTKIKVISESMAQKLADPNLPEQIAEKMQKNGLDEAEIAAAKQRLDKINAAVKSGQIRTVKKTEWGLPEQNTTMEQLASAKESIFDVVQSKVVMPFAKQAKAWFGKPENQRIAEPTKELTYGKALRVDSFGMNAQEQKQLDDLTKEAEKEFRADIENAISTAKNDDSLSMKEYTQFIKDNSKIMVKALEDADPTFSFTSPEYKHLKKAAKELQSLSTKLSKKLKTEDASLNAADSHKLFQAMDKLAQCSALYAAKKQNEIDHGREPSEIGRARMQVNESVADLTRSLRHEFRKTVVADLAKDSALGLVHKQLKQTQKSIAAESGDALRERVAKEIYYMGLEMSSMTAKKSQKLADALDPDVVGHHVARIMQSPAFKQIAQMPDDELRALGQSDQKLMDKYFKARAKEKQNAKTVQVAKQKAALAKQKAAQADPNKNDPNKAQH